MKDSLDTRRRAILAAVGAGIALGPLAVPVRGKAGIGPGRTKPIPSSGESLSVIGMGTWITFNVGRDPVAREARTEVLRTFFEMGGGLIDSSPMYGSAEAVVGAGLRRLGPMPGLFAATKVWTSSGADGPLQIAESQGLWGLDRFDLLQVHNLLAWRAHLDTLFALKAEGKVRYVGITTSHGRRHAELESVMRDKPVDFVQATYNARDREVEQRILPLAAERGIAFIANRPFQGGSLIERVQKHPLPPWAADLDCDNWAQFLLKYIVSHPAVTCAIPATRQIAHMRENMGATLGVLPEPATRALMAKYVADL